MIQNETRRRSQYDELEDDLRAALFGIKVPLNAIHLRRSTPEPNKYQRAAFDLVGIIEGKEVAIVPFKNTDEMKIVLEAILATKQLFILFGGGNPDVLNREPTDEDFQKAFNPAPTPAPAPAPAPVAAPAKSDDSKVIRTDDDRWARAAATRRANTLKKQEDARMERERQERAAKRAANQNGERQHLIAARRGTRRAGGLPALVNLPSRKRRAGR